MGTRGAFGVIIGEKEKIGYNQFDSYPDGKGVENLRWLRTALAAGGLDEIKKLAENCRLVDENTKPTPKDVKALAASTNLSVSEQSTDDWYCLTRGNHGDIGAMLASGYILDYENFALDSLFCEWGYIVDFDTETFEVYEGFQKTLPKRGRWKGRPTKAEDTENYIQHLEWCHENERKPFRPRRSEYKAIELVASWPFSDLPTDEEFEAFFEIKRGWENLKYIKDQPEYITELVNEIVEKGRTEEGEPFADEWAALEKEARSQLARYAPAQLKELAVR